MKPKTKKVLVITLTTTAIITVIVLIILSQVNKLLFNQNQLSKLPFKKSKLIELPVIANTSNAMAIFDTGASISAVDYSAIKKYNIKTLPIKIPVNFSSFHNLGIIYSLKIGSFEFKNVLVVIMDFKNSESFLHCVESDFFLGMPVIRHLSWEFDFTTDSLIVSNIDEFANRIYENKIKYRNKFWPTIEVKVNSENHRLLVDFGYNGNLSVKKMKFSEKSYSYEYSDRANIFGKFSDKGENIIEDVILNQDTIKNILIAYSQNSKNLIGLGIFSNYEQVIINPFEKEIYLFAQKKHNRTNFYYGLGLGIDRQGAAVIISNILENSPAYNAGIVLGDTVEMIENIPVNDQWLSIDYCSFLKKANGVLSNDSISIKLKNKEVVQIKRAKF